MDQMDSEENGSPNQVPESDSVESQLARILNSPKFLSAPRLCDFLRFIVSETLIGRENYIKARTISIKVFERDPADNPSDPLVRIHAGRLRRVLEEYYHGEGTDDPVLIQVPKGGYVPQFSFRSEHSSLSGDAESSRKLPRVAVLPFVNSSESSEHDYFVDGFGEELSIELARFEGLSVLAYWSSSQVNAAKRDRAIATKKLDADYLIIGSIVRESTVLRVRVQCVNGLTNEQLFSQRFDCELTTQVLFEVQDEIVHKIISRIADQYGALPQAIFRASRGKRVEDLSAYEAILEYHQYVRVLDEPSHQRTRKALEHATTVEPDYALAWALLGDVYCDIHSFGLGELEDALGKAGECARRAVSLDQNCQYGHYAMGYVGALRKDHTQVIAAADKIVELNPNAAYMVGAAAVWLSHALQFEKAFALLERSKELNPFYPGWFHIPYWQYAFIQGDYEAALEAAQQINMPNFFWDPLTRAACFGKLGRSQEAKVAFEHLLQLRPDFPERAQQYIEFVVHPQKTINDVMDGLLQTN